MPHSLSLLSTHIHQSTTAPLSTQGVFLTLLKTSSRQVRKTFDNCTAFENMEVMQHALISATRPPTGRPPQAGRRCFFQAGLAGQNHLKMASGSYDMRILRELSRMEEEALQEIVRIFQVESEDSLPVSFDLHQLVDLKEGDRRSFLESMLRVCESDDTTAFIDKWLERIKWLDAKVTDSICSTWPTAVFAKERQHQTSSAVRCLE